MIREVLRTDAAPQSALYAQGTRERREVRTNTRLSQFRHVGTTADAKSDT